jgi:hypothetical protein
LFADKLFQILRKFVPYVLLYAEQRRTLGGIGKGRNLYEVGKTKATRPLQWKRPFV